MFSWTLEKLGRKQTIFNKKRTTAEDIDEQFDRLFNVRERISRKPERCVVNFSRDRRAIHIPMIMLLFFHS